ncbi:cytochrome P450 monooxygenase-like protein [Aaosphaeria arxii CBS 175.79]|uniref:Cytochrome P450 monooxygenase-like protein n=1 Tax=Aaosphaeria arxii CBS 175.79 TaxID=1450172 RepID=A0A6A5Y7B5_9PLEO|nr:cytochrome P450 monooxygenase-like protein [Aaosphaeria arxii CBS 175.79]KAF2021455.1 cytochrome P450 monooxygenase-like protein [Aaosphaeria arxii CBS 175.79]
MESILQLLQDVRGYASPANIGLALGSLIACAAIYAFYGCIYNIYFHPLSHIPGPFLSRASGIPYTLRLRNGSIAPWIQKLHRTYGDAVRVTPTEVSFISGETAWQDIYGFRIGKHAKTGAYSKDLQWFPKPHNGSYSLVGADEETHSRMRKTMSHAFSDKALREQEYLVQELIDQLIQRLHEKVEEKNPVLDITRWYNYTTFDIVTDLTFGESLHCLRDRGTNPWIDMVFSAPKAIGTLATRRKYPIFDYYDRFTAFFSDNSKTVSQRIAFFKLVTTKVEERIAKQTDRPDFMTHILKNNGIGEKALTRPEIVANSALLLVAGSETTATTLSGATWLMLKNPEVYKKVVAEVRSRFTSQDQITMEEVNKLEYLIVMFQEAFRYYPPVPTGFPRIVPPGGDRISGFYIPEGTSVYVSQHATNHSDRNFADPEAFVPERWLKNPDAKYKNDKQSVVNTFSFGPRACLGKNLAYAEMRLIMAKVLFNFDLELQPESYDWMSRMKVFTLWDKPPLMVSLRPVKR